MNENQLLKNVPTTKPEEEIYTDAGTLDKYLEEIRSFNQRYSVYKQIRDQKIMIDTLMVSDQALLDTYESDVATGSVAIQQRKLGLVPIEDSDLVSAIKITRIALNVLAEFMRNNPN